MDNISDSELLNETRRALDEQDRLIAEIQARAERSGLPPLPIRVFELQAEYRRLLDWLAGEMEYPPDRLRVNIGYGLAALYNKNDAQTTLFTPDGEPFMVVGSEARPEMAALRDMAEAWMAGRLYVDPEDHPHEA